MRVIMLLFLASCLTEPDTLYECEGAFVCYGDHFGLTTTTTCQETIDDASSLYLAQALVLAQMAKCDGDLHIKYTCKSVGGCDAE